MKIRTDKSNKSILLELSMPTYAGGLCTYCRMQTEEKKRRNSEPEVVPMAETLAEPETEPTLDLSAGLQAAWNEEEKREWNSDMEKNFKEVSSKIVSCYQ